MCPGAVSLELVSPPAHGTVTAGPFLAYQSVAGYVGPDSFPSALWAPRGVRAR